jgi:hypothetical protein
MISTGAERRAGPSPQFGIAGSSAREWLGIG